MAPVTRLQRRIEHLPLKKKLYVPKVLSKKRKTFIHEFRRNWFEDAQDGQGTEELIDFDLPFKRQRFFKDLYEFLKEKEDEIHFLDVERWVNKHPWITNGEAFDNEQANDDGALMEHSQAPISDAFAVPELPATQDALRRNCEYEDMETSDKDQANDDDGTLMEYNQTPVADAFAVPELSSRQDDDLQPNMENETIENSYNEQAPSTDAAGALKLPSIQDAFPRHLVKNNIGTANNLGSLMAQYQTFSTNAFAAPKLPSIQQLLIFNPNLKNLKGDMRPRNVTASVHSRQDGLQCNLETETIGLPDNDQAHVTDASAAPKLSSIQELHIINPNLKNPKGDMRYSKVAAAGNSRQDGLHRNLETETIGTSNKDQVPSTDAFVNLSGLFSPLHASTDTRPDSANLYNDMAPPPFAPKSQQRKTHAGQKPNADECGESSTEEEEFYLSPSQKDFMQLIERMQDFGFSPSPFDETSITNGFCTFRCQFIINGMIQIAEKYGHGLMNVKEMVKTLEKLRSTYQRVMKKVTMPVSFEEMQRRRQKAMKKEAVENAQKSTEGQEDSFVQHYDDRNLRELWGMGNPQEPESQE